MTLDEISNLGRTDFVAGLCGIFEHSPRVGRIHGQDTLST